jgi:putative addiction module killer protein
VKELREALDSAGRSPYGRWFARLDAPAAARVTTALYRLAQGNLSGVRSVGGGVAELRIEFGPGFASTSVGWGKRS